MHLADEDHVQMVGIEGTEKVAGLGWGGSSEDLLL